MISGTCSAPCKAGRLQAGEAHRSRHTRLPNPNNTLRCAERGPDNQGQSWALTFTHELPWFSAPPDLIQAGLAFHSRPWNWLNFERSTEVCNLSLRSGQVRLPGSPHTKTMTQACSCHKVILPLTMCRGYIFNWFQWADLIHLSSQTWVWKK